MCPPCSAPVDVLVAYPDLLPDGMYEVPPDHPGRVADERLERLQLRRVGIVA
jgi:hypothetical protein